MRKFFVVSAAAGLLAACANQQYAGVNYGEVMTPEGEHWVIAGGKDETNVKFEVKRPDGTVATYSAENADASTVLKQMAVLVDSQTKALSGALAAILARFPAVAP